MTISSRSALTLLLCLSLQTIQTTHLHSQTQPTQSDQKLAPTAPSRQPNPDAAGNYHIGDGVTAPRPIYTVEAYLSDIARKRKIGGRSIVGFRVEANGHVSRVHITWSASAGDVNTNDQEIAATLDQKAIEAVSQYRFEPALFRGKPVPVEMIVEIPFQR